MFGCNRRPVLVDTGNGKDFAVSVALNAHLDSEAVQVGQLFPHLFEVLDGIGSLAHSVTSSYSGTEYRATKNEALYRTSTTRPK